MCLGFQEPLKALVTSKFIRAKASSHLVFTESKLALIRNSRGVYFQLRYCPTLAQKPKATATEQDKGQPQFDPFEDPSEELLVGKVPRSCPSHFLVLNKYPVIPNHFILATIANKPQTNVLEPDDLHLSYSCIKVWQEAEGKSQGQTLFAFFNSGEHSGASQMHRHIQFLPLEVPPGEPETQWRLLLESMTMPTNSSTSMMYNDKLPFEHFAVNINSTITIDSLYEKYLLLLKQAYASTLQASQDVDSVNGDDVDDAISKADTVMFSYNLAMTSRVLAIMPRSSEVSAVAGLPGSKVAINGTILGGTLMVKSEDEWITLQNKPAHLDTLLTNIGFPITPKPSL